MEYLIFAGVVAGVLLLAVLIGYRNEKRAEMRFREKMKRGFGLPPDKSYTIDTALHIPKYFESHPYTDQIDDITWNDLDMDDVFYRVNYCLSDAGEEMLYDRLRKPLAFDEEDYETMERHLAWFKDNEKARIDAQVIFSQLKGNTRFSIYDHLEHLDQLPERENTLHIILLVWMIALLPIVAVFFMPFFALLICIIIFNVVTYFRMKPSIDPYLNSFGYILKLIQGTEKIIKVCRAGYEEECAKLKACTKKMRNFRRGAEVIMSPGRMSSGNPLDLIMDYVRMITHIDIIKFNQMLSQIKGHKDDIDEMIALLGNIEADLSVCCYRASLAEAYCRPTFHEGKRHLIEDGYHPLLKAPVDNTIECEKSVLITGSNASGKSTFLKMCAICSLFAQTIHTVPAKRYEAPVYRIYSSMALRDNLIGGDSYYIVEIKSLKRILDASKEEGRILCFIDEVLRGTNTIERIAASAKILEHFGELDVQCFAATHDIELAELLHDTYMNCHFEGEVKDGDVKFNYLLQHGPARTRNAIKLLELMGYDGQIVRAAEQMGERFVREGAWSLS